MAIDDFRGLRIERIKVASLNKNVSGCGSILAKLMWMDSHSATYFEDSQSILLGG